MILYQNLCALTMEHHKIQYRTQIRVRCMQSIGWVANKIWQSGKTNMTISITGLKSITMGGTYHYFRAEELGTKFP